MVTRRGFLAAGAAFAAFMAVAPSPVKALEKLLAPEEPEDQLKQFEKPEILSEDQHGDVTVDPHFEQQWKDNLGNPEGLRLSRVLATTTLVAGLARLAKGHHLTKNHYGLMTAALAGAYLSSAPDAQEEIKHEVVEGTGMIAKVIGLMQFATSIRADLPQIYKAITGENPNRAERVAASLMLASMTGPLATTVPTAKITGKDYLAMVENIGDESLKHSILKVGREHSANMSGFWLIGDLPVIALMTLYEPASAVAWQAKWCTEPALYSLFSATYKTNYLLNRSDGLAEKEAAKKAFEESNAALAKALPIGVKALGSSLANFGSNLTHPLAGLLHIKPGQFESGLQFDIWQGLRDRMVNIHKLVTQDNPDFILSPVEAQHLVKDAPDAMRASFRNGHVNGGMTNFAVKKAKEPVNEIKQLLETYLDEGDHRAKTIERISHLLDAGLHEKDPIMARLRFTEASGLAAVHEVDISGPIATLSHLAEHINNPDTLKKLSLSEIGRRLTDPDGQELALSGPVAEGGAVLAFQFLFIPTILPVIRDAIQTVNRHFDSPLTSTACVGGAAYLASLGADNLAVCYTAMKADPSKPQNGWHPSIVAGPAFYGANPAPNSSFAALKDLPMTADLNLKKALSVHGDQAAFTFAWLYALNAMKVAPPKLREGAFLEQHAAKPVPAPEATPA